MYKQTWRSLCSHPVPEWFRDEKFGIYTHWGPYTVPAYGGDSDALTGNRGGYNSAWYPRNMYQNGHPCAIHHEKTYGHPREFGYKDLIPLFTAEKFDPDEWVEIFRDSGARFVGPTAQLHDGFALWDSKVNRWNCKAMGPKRDIMGEFTDSARGAGLKFVTTFHHSYQWFFYQLARNEGYDLDNPEFEDLYVRAHDPREMPDKAYHDRWLQQILEVIDQYSPDLLWFDFGLKWIRDDYKKQFLAYYFNEALKKKQAVGVTFKNNDLPPGAGIFDLEVGKMDDLCQFPWLTDTSIDCVPRGNWAYAKAAGFKSPERIIHNLVDRVSKNGQLLLNVGPRPDGTIPEGAKRVLKKVGEWLRINGEAIYGTRPWLVAGEGPTKKSVEKAGHFNETGEARFCAHDIRFTAGENALYATCLGIPGDQVSINTFKTRVSPEEIADVTLLGVEGSLSWRHDWDEGLIIDVPGKVPSDYANTFKITMK
ncbi:MAG: alpha-L-fucosidase [Lentisphaeria bacterium]|nr:alpha-L-fucosidase [Lentisphaeria bacterium]